MPVCTLHLLALSTPIPAFLSALRSTDLKPLTVARVIRWIITPAHLSTQPLLSSQWDILIILPLSSRTLPSELQTLIQSSWTIEAGIPSRIVDGYHEKNLHLLHPSPNSMREFLTTSAKMQYTESSQDLELTRELHRWTQTADSPQGAISMLNLLSFLPGKKEQYLKYGEAFAKDVGASKGGLAKIVGKIVPHSCSGGCGEWDEMALAHYPSLTHFVQMIGSQAYQDVNHRWRVPSLKDTLILCTSELDLDDSSPKARL